MQAGLVDVLVEAQAEHLVEQVGNLVARIAGGIGHLGQVQVRIEIGLGLLKVVLQVARQQAQLLGRKPQAAGRRPAVAAGLGSAAAFVDQRGVFVDAPDQAVAHGDRLAGAERSQAAAEGHPQAVLDEGGIAVEADTVGVLQRLVGALGHGRLDVLAEIGQAHPAVLEEVVVFDLGMIERHHRVDVAVLPTEVVAHDRLAGGVGEVAVGGNGLFGLHAAKDAIAAAGGTVPRRHPCTG